jgi:uncharacterized protein YbbC (DUF1343 family)
MVKHIRLGIDVLVQQGFDRLEGKNLGLLTNLSTVDSRLIPTYSVFLRQKNLAFRTLFAPEHGFAGALSEGKKFATATDPRTGLPVYSLYGENIRPTKQMLDGLDLVVCDIQDIGVRYYTFIWTLSHMLEAAGEAGVSVLVLDRPNPLGGLRLEGPILDPALASLVGRFPVPVVHGLTMGEMARLINALYNPTPAQLEVVPAEGWERALTWGDLSLPWVPPSPNMPSFNALLQYPGSCFLEGTNLSEGRGTALPFEVVGAPFIDAFDLADALNRRGFGGVLFRPHQFMPSTSKWSGALCKGVQAHITDRESFRPVETWMQVIEQIRLMYSDQFSWLPNPFGVLHIDRLVGSALWRELIERPSSAMSLFPAYIEGLQAPLEAFRVTRRPFLLYSEE